jgi:hypothetical protein
VPSWVRARVAGADFSNFCVLSDTNLGKAKISTSFRADARASGFSARPLDPAEGTTRKRRSKLHGQTYDAAKCHVTVEAPKDVILAKAGGFFAPPSEAAAAASAALSPAKVPSGSSMGHPANSHYRRLSTVSATGEMALQPVYPALHFFQGLFARTLPDSAWASDHCLVTAAIALEPPLPEEVAAVKEAKDDEADKIYDL